MNPDARKDLKKHLCGYSQQILGQAKIYAEMIRSFVHWEHVPCPDTSSNELGNKIPCFGQAYVLRVIAWKGH